MAKIDRYSYNSDMAVTSYEPKYTNSHALIVGIDKYQRCNPLAHAVSDAKAIAEILTAKFQFSEPNVTVLLDGQATRDEIATRFLQFRDSVGPNDRILVFFAGHGHTATGRRGEVGYLVPVDGNVNDLATLIRWDELTRNTDLIPAKHILFLMDACYGGLALTRKTIPPGSMRFLKDMLQRYSRQVLTAGKADEVVADAGGTRPGHSIFTSHVLDAMEGASAVSDGIVTANGLMSYVYEKVSTDAQSHQTPHYGFIDGDGDFIFDTSPLDQLQANPETGPDILIKTPTYAAPELPPAETIAENLKKLIGSPNERIRLDDFIAAHLRRAVQAIGVDKFPVQGRPDQSAVVKEIPERLKRYEDAMSDIQVAAILLARWAEANQLGHLEKIFARLGEVDREIGGLNVWLNLSWYPVLYLMYSAGIAALAGGQFDALRSALLTDVQTSRARTRTGVGPILLPVVSAMVDDTNVFKALPGMERRYAPRSDYLFKTLQPVLEDHLFLGRSYEMLFDRYEIMLALVYADIRAGADLGHVWGPPGRFAWKERGIASSDTPFSNFVDEVKQAGPSWDGFKCGFFGGSLERFERIVSGYYELLNQLSSF